jgi:hypothetical protein
VLREHLDEFRGEFQPFNTHAAGPAAYYVTLNVGYGSLNRRQAQGNRRNCVSREMRPHESTADANLGQSSNCSNRALMGVDVDLDVHLISRTVAVFHTFSGGRARRPDSRLADNPSIRREGLWTPRLNPGTGKLPNFM